ncbi:hypothetical protein [Kribbella sp. CA-293567]|nr:hypothetical protein [Kribbella sp. CA-293567]WBQ01898.1 hypothetical protein OX958_18080 [Kribbella sp. CA-293567]
MRTDLLFWILAVILTVAGLVYALRYRVVLGAVLIAGGLALGLVSSIEQA